MIPAISGTTPTEQQARDRVALLAARHASFVTSDWSRLPAVLTLVLPRGRPPALRFKSALRGRI